jgi:tetratricopeptide (TPR) repeat protein
MNAPMHRRLLCLARLHVFAALALTPLLVSLGGCISNTASAGLSAHDVNRSAAMPTHKSGTPESLRARQRADTLWAQQRFLEAGDEYRKVIRDHPRNAVAHYRLGWIVQHHLLQTGEAARLHKKAISLDPRLADAYCALGDIAFAMKGDVVEAEKLYRKALSLREDALFRMQLATILLATKRREEALQHARRAVTDGYSKSNPTLEEFGLHPVVPTPPRHQLISPRGYST